MGNECTSKVRSVLRNNHINETTVLSSKLVQDISMKLSKNKDAAMEKRKAKVFLSELFKELGTPHDKQQISLIVQNCTVNNQFSFNLFKRLLKTTLPPGRLSQSLNQTSSESEEVFEFTFSEDSTEDSAEDDFSYGDFSSYYKRASAGRLHTVYLDENNQMWAVGGHYGENSVSEDQCATCIPKQFQLPPIVTVSCGDDFTVCVDNMGNVYSFGMNNKYQLGTGDNNFEVQPQKIHGIPPIMLAKCGSSHTLLLDENRCIWAFGDNSHGQLGLDRKLVNTAVKSPRKVGLSHIQLFDCGNKYSVVMNDSGIVYSSGINSAGQLGSGNFESQCVFSQMDKFPKKITEICCGNSHCVVLTASGKVYSAGCNRERELGFHDCMSRTRLERVTDLPMMTQLFCKGHRTMCIDASKMLWVFGSNKFCELGVELNETDPTIVENIPNVQFLALGNHHTIVKTDEGIIGFGDNSAGQLGVTPGEQFLPILIPTTLQSIL